MEAMLAKEYRKGMKTPTSDKECKPPIGWYASEKYDGYRALFDSSSRTLLSRAQNPFISPQWFIDMLPDNDLDGELWVGRENFEQMGVVRRKKPNDEDWLPIKEEIITELVTLIEKFEGTNNAESFRSMLEMFKNYQIKKEALDQEPRN